METQAEAISIAARRLNGELTRAVGLILAHAGKVAVTGSGESEHLARRLAASLNETGTPSVFLEPANAARGEVAAYAPGDPTLIVSETGGAAELLEMAAVLRGFGSPLVAILGRRAAPLSPKVDVVLDASVTLEFSPRSLRSATSAAVLAALGDALVFTVLRSRRLPLDDLARLFPPDQHEVNLRLTVAEVMHRGQTIARVQREDTVREVACAITRHPLGAACVTSPHGRLEGLITERDLSRVLQAKEDISFLRAADIMTASPVTVSPDTPLHEALRLLENVAPPLSVLPVVNSAEGRCLGLIRLLDICQAGLA
jgi:arabinose-5-phosphate isomerase